MNKKKIWIWCEMGEVFALEDGDTKPHEVCVNIYVNNDANKALNDEIDNLISNGYTVKIGRPEYLGEFWGIESEESK